MGVSQNENTNYKILENIQKMDHFLLGCGPFYALG